MNERTVRHDPAPRYEPAAAPPRQPARAYEKPPQQAPRVARQSPRELARGAERDAEVTAERTDGYWFRQWVNAPTGSAEGGTADASPLAGLVGVENSEVEAFVDQLSPRLHATLDTQLDMLLHLPHLGRIQVSARRLNGGQGWDIGLSGENEAVHARLSSRACHFEDALTQSLGQPVVVRVDRDERHA